MDAVTHLLDTHTVIWAYDDSKFLGGQAREIISQAAPRTLSVSDFTLLEISMLVSKRRLQLDLPVKDFLERVERDYLVIPLGAAEAVSAMKLKLKQADPFDRVIAATAYLRKIPLLTRDHNITISSLVQVIW